MGNNPLCIAIPRKKGSIVLDMAMSQYTYGKLSVYRLAGEQLPYPGGFDENGSMTCDPNIIINSGRTLPISCWKGAGMAIAQE